MPQDNERGSSFAEVFFQQGIERHWRFEAARVVAKWLKQKMMDYEIVSGRTRSFMAESVWAGLRTGEIYFRVTEETELPLRPRVILIRTPPSEGREGRVWKAVTLEVQQGITPEELVELGDSVLEELFAHHLRVVRQDGRLLPQDGVKARLSGFGPFPQLNSEEDSFPSNSGPNYDLGV